ncbi:hypothetical protein K505DRAFT_61118 [Melanomma pulvis-pyrius CBS 109.77]|uniref:Uncharacterized protein n=1 Tax=Melanomma pulvis-pyrius CBS 109.77 TaxID=1314802 RepID=A0A6A6X6E0_9PLEO|nr:hypothetical protein K505DRAFT_61118 [Melanomma pulvis-pyrius CBS 109.77]
MGLALGWRLASAATRTWNWARAGSSSPMASCLRGKIARALTAAGRGVCQSGLSCLACLEWRRGRAGGPETAGNSPASTWNKSHRAHTRGHGRLPPFTQHSARPLNKYTGLRTVCPPRCVSRAFIRRGGNCHHHHPPARTIGIALPSLAHRCESRPLSLCCSPHSPTSTRPRRHHLAAALHQGRPDVAIAPYKSAAQPVPAVVATLLHRAPRSALS